MKIGCRFDIVVAVLLALIATACAPRDALWVHEHLATSENFHAGTKILETPRIPNAGKHAAILRATAHTRGKKLGADIELAVRAQFDDFSFLDRVSFASGRAFPLTIVKRETEDCGTTDKSLCDVWEFVTVKLSRKFLTTKRASGFDVKLWGRRDSVVLFVPPEYIEGLLSRMENRPPEILATVPKAPQGPFPASPAP